MKTKQIFLTALRSLRRHKMRSLLTTLGIIIGVLAIIVVMSLSEGAKTRVRQEIEKIGTNFIIVLAGAPKHKTIGQAQTGIGHFTIKPRDVEAIEDECDDVYQVSPGVMTMAVAVHENKNWETQIAGVAENYFEIRDWRFKYGEPLSKSDVRIAKKVAIIGETVADELFGNTDPLSKTIRIQGMPFKVIGVLTPKGKLPNGQDQDDMIFAPITTVQRKIMGIHNYQAILISARKRDRLHAAERQIRSVLRQKHKLAPTEKDDFTIFTQDDIAQASEAATRVLNILLLIFASISLIVGGVGIMNIMLVTVTERTKEIGIRMALGATPKSILRQFILESISICLTGGLIGLLIGIGIAKSISLALAWPIFISNFSILLSLSSSILVGLFFGYYPAYLASLLNPVDALATGK